ncbi:MAG: phage tail tip lysozyme, partial [Streptosporangiaceae bacterium]
QLVAQVQKAAKTVTSGSYDSATRQAVASWQAAHHLSATGQAVTRTMSAMGITRAIQCDGPPAGTPLPVASNAAAIQWDLAGLGYLGWTGISGVTDPRSARALEGFQANQCLPVTGQASAGTLQALGRLVAQVQRAAKARASGSYNPVTRQAVASWQGARHLGASGQAGRSTMSAMGIARTSRCASRPPSAAFPRTVVGTAIASVAESQVHNATRNRAIPGSRCNFYASQLGLTGPGGTCVGGWPGRQAGAAFAIWVWRRAGRSVGGLTPAAASFYSYGRANGTWNTGNPMVGDVAVIGLTGDHARARQAGVVTATSPGTFTMVSGGAGTSGKALVTQTLSDSAASGFIDPLTAALPANAQTAFDYFVHQGLSKVQSAGIIGNLMQESSVDPTTYQLNGGPGRGIAQWGAGGRWDTYSNDNVVWYAGQHGQSEWSLSLQLDFTWYELQTYNNYGLGSLRAASDITAAVDAFQNYFEACGTCDTSNRISFADQALADYGSSAGVGATIAAIAAKNLNKVGGCATNSAGGVGYYTSCTGNGGLPEYWCSDFAKWVWAQAGVDVSGITPSAATFAHDGLQSTPQVGDAVLFGLNSSHSYATHVAIVVQVNSNGTIVTIGGDENGPNNTPESYYSSHSKVAEDGPYLSAIGDKGLNGPISGYVSPPTGSAPPPGTGGSKPANSVWVTTFASAGGYASTNESTRVGTLYGGTNYVYCKKWGAMVGNSTSYNHYWLWTDLDTGGQGWVSAYYLSNWGNDQAKDNSGNVIPTCSSSTGGATSGEYQKWWITTDSAANGYASTNENTKVGALQQGINYVFCKKWGAMVGNSTSYNHYWLWTDLDTGGQGWVSAYYLSLWGNDQAKDNSGNVIPTCGSGTTKYYVDTYASAGGYAQPNENTRVGTLNGGTNYVFCKAWGAMVGNSTSYNHWWLWTDLDTGGQGWVSAYYLSLWGNDQAKDNNGNVIPTCAGSSGNHSSGSNKYWVTTFASASGYAAPNENTQVGTLNAGVNYVYCKKWGALVQNGQEYNHWWLYTDLDTGGQGWVSAYYLSNWGNDQARDNSGNIIPTC